MLRVKTLRLWASHGLCHGLWLNHKYTETVAGSGCLRIRGDTIKRVNMVLPCTKRPLRRPYGRLNMIKCLLGCPSSRTGNSSLWVLLQIEGGCNYIIYFFNLIRVYGINDLKPNEFCLIIKPSLISMMFKLLTDLLTYKTWKSLNQFNIPFLSCFITSSSISPAFFAGLQCNYKSPLCCIKWENLYGLLSMKLAGETEGRRSWMSSCSSGCCFE